VNQITRTEPRTEQQRVTYLALCDGREGGAGTVWIIGLSDPPPAARDRDANEDD